MSKAGDPEKDKILKKTVKDFCKTVNPNLLTNADHRTLRHAARDIKKKLADIEFYRDIRTRQD